MAGYQECIDTIRKVDETLTDDEISMLVGDLQQRQKVLMATGEALNLHDAAMKAADELGRSMELTAALMKRQAAENLIKKNEVAKSLDTHWAKDKVGGITAWLMGSNKAVQGARDSVKARFAGMHNRYLGGLFADIDTAGLQAAFLNSDKAFHLEVAQAVVAAGGGKAAPNVSPEALKLGQIIHKWQETARLNVNKAGGYVGKLDDYFLTQSHDPFRMRAYGGQNGAEWKAYMLQNLDWARMGFDPTDVKGAMKFLDKEYGRIMSGRFETEGAGVPADMPGSLAKRVSAERVFHFTDTKAAFEYNEKFGKADFRGAVLNGLRRSAQNTALLQKMGSNPEHMLLEVIDMQAKKLADEGDHEGAKALSDKVPFFKDMLTNLDGRVNVVRDAGVAAIGETVRTLESFKLGGMLLSQLSDIGISGAMARNVGGGFIDGMLARVKGLATNAHKDIESRALLSSIGVYLEHHNNVVMSQSAVEGGVPGWLAKSASMFQRLTGGPWWQDRGRIASGLFLGHHAAVMGEVPFDALPARFKTLLQEYNINANEWELMRTHGIKEVQGAKYMVPTEMRNIPDEAVRGIAGDNPVAIAKAKQSLDDKLYNMFADQITYMALEPDANTRRIINKGVIFNQGQERGTAGGEAVRSALQFKGFTVAYVNKVLGTLLQADTMGQGFSNLIRGKGDMAGLAGLVAASTVFGYTSMALKDLVKGKKPRDITENPAKVTMAAMAQGGGLGIYGDFLFGEANRYGGGITSTLAGPAFGDAINLAQMTNELVHGESKSADWVRFAYSHAPNLWYTKMAFDHLIAYKTYEALNPGYLARMEQRMKRENNQEFWLRPSP